MEKPTKEQLEQIIDHPEELNDVIQAFEDDTVAWLPYRIVKQLIENNLWIDEEDADGWKPFSEWNGEMYCLLYFPDLDKNKKRYQRPEDLQSTQSTFSGTHKVNGVIFAQLNRFGHILPKIGEIYTGKYKPTKFKEVKGAI